MMMGIRSYPLFLLTILFFLASCDSEQSQNASSTPATVNTGVVLVSGWESNKGVGPVQSVTLDTTINKEMAATGAQLYKEKCTSCHKPDKRYIGPAPKGIFERRTPEWVMNMILNPEEMVKKDTIAKLLLKEYDTSPMTNQYLTEVEARNILEYFRTL